MNKLNKTSGITLIALVITIIVLLILAGITISALTGSDSAPAKANEAKQKNDIGSAKDQLAVLVQNAQTEAYDDIYVKGNKTVKLTDSATEVGQRVITAALAQYETAKQIGDATMVISQSATGQDAKVTITTRDYKQEGTIAITSGTLTWEALTENTGTPPGGGTTYTAYSVGDTVRISNQDFYVIADSDANNPTLKLFAKYCLSYTKSDDSYTDLVQSEDESTGMELSSDIVNIYNESDVEDIINAYVSTLNVTGATGRLLLLSDIYNLGGTIDMGEVTSDYNSIFGVSESVSYGYYLGPADVDDFFDDEVYYIYQSSNILYSWYNDETLCSKIRPVIVISKDNLPAD
ncbi:MAG: type II secretion system protein [Clostridia bacterium]|nr:type II secretion system protein [Clostridia bacterium]